MTSNTLSVVVIKPSKYGPSGVVERFRKGFMPNSTLRHMAALTPDRVADKSVEVTLIELKRLNPEVAAF